MTPFRLKRVERNGGDVVFDERMLDEERGEKVNWQLAPVGFGLELARIGSGGCDRFPPVPCASGWLSDAGWKTKERIESVTDELAAPPYASLEPSELDQLIADLEPISATLDAAGSR